MSRKKGSPYRVERWVCRQRSGQFSADEHQGSWVDNLSEAYIYVGRPRPTVAVEAVRVTVILSGHEAEADDHAGEVD